jgi:hypothetical protein
MDMRMKVDELPEGLNAGDDILTTEHLPINRDGGLPSGAGEFPEQPAVMATVDPQPLGDRKDELPMRDRGADGLCNRLGGEQSAFLMATWTEATLLAGEGDEHLVAAVGATDACEAEVQIAAAMESLGHVADDRRPWAVAPGVVLVVGPLQLGQVTFDGLIQRRLSRLARTVNRCVLGGETDNNDDTRKGLDSEARTING